MPELQYPSIVSSLDILRRAELRIPAQTQTLAKGPGQHVRGVAPVYAQRAKGAHIWDVDGNRYLDYTMAVGPLLLGYGHEVVDKAIEKQLRDGITFSLMHPLEVEVAELLNTVIPNAEMVRYSKTGCDVTSAAIRLARAYTGKSTVLCCGYHGWHDWFVGTTDRNMGIPQSTRDLTYTFEYNNIESLHRAIDEDTAAVILEPMVFEQPEDNYLREVRELCTARGIVLIFDEMWTGFRLAVGGAQERFGVAADLACFSKAIANGMPLSVLTGRADIMRLCEKDVFFFTTFGGEALSLAAAKATVTFLREHDVPLRVEEAGNLLRSGIEEIIAHEAADYISVRGLGARTMLKFDERAVDPLMAKSLVQQEFLRFGILWGGFQTLSYAHTVEDLALTLDAFREVIPMLHQGVVHRTVADMLRGAPMEPVFRKTGNFNTKPRLSTELR